MLLRFTISNFLSFSEEVEFNMFPANFKIHKSHVYHTEGGIELLKAAAIYGANGSGKSNFIEAIEFFHDIIHNGETLTLTPPYFKLDEDYSKLPTSLEIEIKINGQFLIYGISLIDDYIAKEWLHESFSLENKVEVIFERKYKNKKSEITSIHKKYLKDEKAKMRFEIYEEDLLNDTLFLPKVGSYIPEAQSVLLWFYNSLTIIKPDTTYALAKRLNEDKDFAVYVNEFLKHMNLGMAKVDTKLIDIKVFFGENDVDELLALSSTIMIPMLRLKRVGRFM
jgi:uncharacterized protein